MALMKGYVTTLESILGKTNYELERSLGFNEESLKPGFELYALTEAVYEGEFIWRDKTRYSGGWHADASIRRPSAYPDAPSGNIPQWELTVKKQFTLIGEYHHGIPSRI